MMSQSERFITQMKLGELRVQRERLLTAYDSLARALSAMPDDADQLALLYHRLRQMTFAQHPLHPDIANLEPILHDISYSARPATETITFWRDRLLRTLAQGRLRADIVYVFGRLLEEWAEHDSPAAVLREQSSAMRSTYIAEATAPMPDVPEPALLDAAIAALDRASPGFRSRLASALTAAMREPVTSDELIQTLHRIAENSHYTDALRQQAQTFEHDPLLLKEFADALTIMLMRLDEWQWPEEGVPAHVVWTPLKWRLFVDAPLPAACLLDLIGRRWYAELHEGRSGATPMWRFRRSAFIHTRRLLERVGANDPTMSRPVDIWTTAEATARVAAEPQAPLDYGSIHELRARYAAQCADFDTRDSYGAKNAGTWGGMETMLGVINAEIRTGQAAFPNRPQYVLKLDLKGFYPTLPHPLLSAVLARLGLPDALHRFVARFVAIPVATDGGTQRFTQGIPNEHSLSDVLAECVLLLLDVWVREQAQVQVFRVIDDMCLVAADPAEAQKAWQAIQSFCDGFGLAISAEKSGAVAIGGVLPEGLPTTPVRWLMLQLTKDGLWAVNERTYAAYLDQIRQIVRATPGVFGQVAVYNASIDYLVRALALGLDLGDSHRSAVNGAMQRWHDAFWDEGRGLGDVLRAQLTAQEGVGHLPQAWLYWPLTAGGLGLSHAGVVAASYSLGLLQREAIRPPRTRGADWQNTAGDWALYYQQWLKPVVAQSPEPDSVMETLVDDFIRRGAEISSGKQTRLSSYWRWIVYLYGPAIRDTFGTFRFLMTEYVPVQLIGQKYRASGETDDAADGLDPDDLPF